jgi:hypothetical protein
LIYASTAEFLGELFIRGLQFIPERFRTGRVRLSPCLDLLDHAHGLGAAVYITHDESGAGRDGHAVFGDAGVPCLWGIVHESAYAGCKVWRGAWVAEGGKDGRGEAAVDASAVDGGGDVEA